MVSVKLLNNYAFLVISLAMLGFAVSGIVVTRYLRRFTNDFADTGAVCSALFALTMIGSVIVFYWVPTSIAYAHTRADFVSALLRSMPLALLFGLPFVFCGLILGALLSLPGLPTPRVYGADLVGSAVGAIVVLPALIHVGAERAMLAACALMIVGALMLTRPRRVPARVLGAGAILALLAATVLHDRAFQMRYPDRSMLADTRKIQHIAWDPVARIELSTFTAAHGFA